MYANKSVQKFSSEAVSKLNFESLFKSTPSPYLILLPDDNFTIVEVNEAYLQATAMQRENMIGKGIFEVFPDNPEVPSATGVNNLRASLTRVVRSQQADTMPIQKYDIPSKEAEGSFEERYWSPYNVPVFGEQGTLDYIIHRVEDVTEFIRLKQQRTLESALTQTLQARGAQMEVAIYKHSKEMGEAQEALRASNERYYKLNSILPVGIFHTDEEGNCLYVNPRVWAQITPEIAENGQINGYVGSFTDITERKKLEEERKKQAEELASINRAKSIFFSNASHEFRTPLTLILGPVEDSLVDTEQPLLPRQKERLILVRRNALRLLKLVNSLLDFSRIEAGRMQANYEPTDLIQLTKEILDVFRPAIEKAGLKLNLDIIPWDAPVYVDKDMWEKIVFNLLSNALKYTLEGSITVTLKRKDNLIELNVSDTGVGIPEKELPQIFERFYRVENLHGRSHEGVGIVYLCDS